MNNSVPVLSMAFMGISIAGVVAIPIGLMIYLQKKHGCKIRAFLTGCLVMILFAFVLEAMVHNLVLPSALGERIQENVFLYALYGGLMAALFEETGRYLAIRHVLRKEQENDYNALMYGAGHGGIEAISVLGVAMVNNLVLSMMINSGSTESMTSAMGPEALTAFEQGVEALVTSPSWLFLIGFMERISAIILQLSLSVLVWYAVKANKRALFLLAIVLHLVVDFVSVLLSSSSNVHLMVVEAVIFGFALACAYLAYRVMAQNRAADLPQDA